MLIYFELLEKYMHQILYIALLKMLLLFTYFLNGRLFNALHDNFSLLNGAPLPYILALSSNVLELLTFT